MHWKKTVASKCRYGEIAESIWGLWDILWEDSLDDYQGHARILARSGRKYCYYEWSYGSCSGCDSWEDAGLSDTDIRKEMMDTALWLYTDEEFINWLEMLQANSPEVFKKFGFEKIADCDPRIGLMLKLEN